ncbi:Pimeloyl-ACP methyl ester carboxylesterase [Saccharopolyspora kobensis]|uniref:Pimeloyl-ACP methyl ester carboxylesterase n=1 Tax=Saccharopolyspora kobensis TaxID=146035 RepID=A0A1H5XAW0_9PSEU|nr:alpha/beta fold hydrolase [Saccharopolyspora kobensis]SEG08487.1 Pimeloyl-ACP methyl ester carboxylesterase [Saccharopolyspora kobensis]SFE45589.1 Pimeloyl-ACP methyl ester carboxylesterase [Saccharopolyspora kobensis]
MGFRDPADAESFFAAYDAAFARWPVPLEARDLRSAWGTTRVHLCGNPGGTPLVLLPGGGATSAIWAANVEALGRTHRIHAVDLLGEAGRSVVGGEPVRDLDGLMSWLDDVFDQLGLETADLCGHSYGAWIALHHAVRSTRVRRLALLDPTACFTRWNPRYLLRALPTLLRPDPRRTRDFLRWETAGAEIDADQLELLARAATFQRAKVITGPKPEPTRLAVPTLVVGAAKSKAHDVDRLIAEANRAVPDVRTEVLADVGHHAIPGCRADHLNALLADFLAG